MWFFLSANCFFLLPLTAFAGVLNMPPPLPGIVEPNLDLEHILDNDVNKTTKTSDRNYILPTSRRWPGGVVPYTIDSSLAECTDVINEAIAAIEEASCLDFVVRTTETGYVNMHRDAGDGGCYATVGYVSATSISCFHEHTRPDRDTYVDVNWDKIETANKHNFYKNAAEGTLPGPTICTDGLTAAQLDMCVQDTEADTFGLSYDFDSIMHYGSNFFSIDDSLTLTSIVPDNSVNAQRSAMSTLDKYKLNAAYSCTGEYPKTCGGLLEGPSGTMINSADTDCRWDIVAPQGSYVIVEFHAVDENNDCVTVEEPILSKSTDYCSGTPPTAYVSGNNQVSVALTRSNPPGEFYATYRVFTLSGAEKCCQSLTFSEGGSTNYASQVYSSAYLGTYTKNGDTTTDPTQGEFPVYENNGLFLAHEDGAPRFRTPWVIVSTPGTPSSNTQFGPSSLACPEDATTAVYADFALASPALVDFPDYSLTCITTCSNSDIPPAISGYTTATDTSPATFDHGDTIAYQNDENPGCYIYSFCLKESGTWTPLVATDNCPNNSVGSTENPVFFF